MSSIFSKLLVNFTTSLLSSKTVNPTNFLKLSKYKVLVQGGKELNSIVKYGYKHFIIVEIFGFDIAPHNSKLLRKSGILKYRTISEIKMVMRYLVFSKNKMEIKFSLVDKWGYCFHWFWAMVFLVAGFIGYINLSNQLNITTYILHGSLFIGMLLVGFGIIHCFIAPFVLAKKIKIELVLK